MQGAGCRGLFWEATRVHGFGRRIPGPPHPESCSLSRILPLATQDRFWHGELPFQPEWRNWQTRMVQVHVPVKGVEVQILSPVLLRL